MANWNATHGNMLRNYDFDGMEKQGGRAACTVGALRAQAEHVDTTPVSRGGNDPRQSSDAVVTSMDVLSLLG